MPAKVFLALAKFSRSHACQSGLISEVRSEVKDCPRYSRTANACVADIRGPDRRRDLCSVPLEVLLTEKALGFPAAAPRCASLRVDDTSSRLTDCRKQNTQRLLRLFVWRQNSSCMRRGSPETHQDFEVRCVAPFEQRLPEVAEHRDKNVQNARVLACRRRRAVRPAPPPSEPGAE